MPAVDNARLPFEEQIAFFRRKLNLPSQRWDDIQRGAHDRAFIVAGAMKGDLLSDLRGAVDDAIAKGVGIGEFRKQFDAIVAKHGWSGWTGEGSKAGRAWRTRVIYQTNISSSYAAGRLKQLRDPELLKLKPLWMYKHNDSVAHPRPLHESWDKTTLPPDDDWWKTHFTPNGWGCKCAIVAVSRKEAEARGAKFKAPTAWNDTEGIDDGWDYMPGDSRAHPMHDFISKKLIRLDAPIGAAMAEALEPVLRMERQLAWYETLDRWLSDHYPRRRHFVVGAIAPGVLMALKSLDISAPVSAEIAVQDRLVVGAKQRRHKASQDAFSVEDWRALPALIAGARALWDVRSKKLVYAATVGDGSKRAVVELGFEIKKPKKNLNMIVSGFVVPAASIEGEIKGGGYVELK